MELTQSFAALSDVLDGYESRGWGVRDVETTVVDADGGVLRARLDVPVSLRVGPADRAADADAGPNLDPESATLTDAGELRVEVPVADLVDPPSATGASVETVDRAVRVAGGGVVATVELVVDPTGSAGETDATPTGASATSVGAGTDADDADDADEEAAAGTDDPLASVRDESVPPYEDVPYLRRLYETCDSFAEMSREIPMDVSAETVRRYMIDADVHDPTPYDTSAGDEGDGDEPSGTGATDDEDGEASTTADLIRDVPDEQLVADGVGLPADLEFADVADAVVDSRTAYEVHRHLGIDQERTRELLRQLNLLDLVLRRVDDDPDRRVSYDEVAARIRGSVPSEA